MHISKEHADAGLVPISPMMIFPKAMGKFHIFLKQGDAYVLYASAEERFTDRHKEVLSENGVREVYILPQQKERYSQYLEENLGEVLRDESIPMEERAGVLYSASVDLIKDAFESNLPAPFGDKQFERLHDMVRQSASFLTLDSALRAMAQFISHDYKTYSHCVQVFVYTLSLLIQYDMKGEGLVQCGLGALLHDLGKCKIPRHILNKRGKLTDEERTIVNTHPLHGVSLCTQLPLGSNAINTILFHHERLDGGGYPSRLRGKDITIPVRAVSICDVYDALTSTRPYAPSMRPYQALKLMSEQMRGAFDLDMLKQFVEMLSGADML